MYIIFTLNVFGSFHYKYILHIQLKYISVLNIKSTRIFKRIKKSGISYF